VELGTLPLGKRLVPPRFAGFVVLLAAGLAVRLVMGAGWADALAIGFDIAAAAFLLSLLPLFTHGDEQSMRRASRDNDANRGLVLVITTTLTLVVMAAIAGELPVAKAGSSWALLRLIGTLALTWFFANAVYALHYAHEFYRSGAKAGTDAGGLQFPETATPDYFDFAYFAFTLGMTFQTSDVAITSGAIRRIVTLHSFAAFVFNIGVIAFTINAIGGK
jgi:uncharacterized membrane protein